MDVMYEKAIEVPIETVMRHSLIVMMNTLQPAPVVNENRMKVTCRTEYHLYFGWFGKLISHGKLGPA